MVCFWVGAKLSKKGEILMNKSKKLLSVFLAVVMAKLRIQL